MSLASKPTPPGRGQGEGPTKAAASLPSQRLVSLDLFRGATIAGMFVVNTPGSWEHVYPQLLHAEWNGWTYTDTIFPFFLFIVGVSMAFSFSRRLSEGGDRRALLLHTLRRAAVIFGLGLGLNILSFFLFHRAQVRIPGVLQRIGVCFFFAALIYLLFGRKGLLPAAAVLLAVYWALMTFIPAPGYGTGRLDVEGNLAAYVDRAVLGAHTWKHDPAWDPEGLLSSLSAIATTLFGILAGEWLRLRQGWGPRLAGLMGGGAVGFSFGLLWSVSFPINKNLWTSSYSLLMSGLAAMCLALCLWIVEVKGWRTWAKPFVWLGMNAIALFVAATLATLLLLWIKLTGEDGKRRSLYGTIYRTVFDHFADQRVGSLLFALTFCAFWIAVGGLLYRKKIFIKV
ncbi:MAG TPA: heparan-alpha-glucosaminide N-acetyltransferase domain-containing protein [Thermoanaerobaculia bacterium]|nr:heparan-alpha-glucosaminide N-acetyltransferase domain-containing protein [Thermoanaerobaculia bacterium]